MDAEFVPWFLYPALSYTYFMSSIGIISHGLFIRQFIRDGTFRSRYNFFCLWRSLMNILSMLINLYSHNKVIISRKTYVSHVVLQVTFSAATYLMSSELILAMNRFSVIVFWRSYDVIFTRRNSMIFAMVPLLLACIVMTSSVVRDCHIELSMKALDFQFGSKKPFCIALSEDILYANCTIFLVTLFINIITSSVLLRLAYKNNTKGTSSFPSHTSRNIRSFIHSFSQLLLWTLMLFDYGFIDISSFPVPFLAFITITSTYTNRAVLEGVLLVFFNWKSIRARTNNTLVNPISRTF